MEKVNAKKVTTESLHGVTVPVTYWEDGNNQTKEVQVVYRGLSKLDAQAADLQIKEETTERGQMARYLATVVAMLPGFVTDDGTAPEPTFEFFEAMDLKLGKSIVKAINKDIDPGE